MKYTNTSKAGKGSEKSVSLAADLLLTAWILFVAVAYFGVLVDPRIGLQTQRLSVGYAIMFLLSVLVVALRYLNRSRDDQHAKHHQRPL